MDPSEFNELKESIDNYTEVNEEDYLLFLEEVYDHKTTTADCREIKSSEKCMKIMDSTTKMLETTQSSTFDLLVEYSQAIAYAPNGSVELARAFGNRSAILCNGRLYEDSLKDINRALTLSYPDNLKSKLYTRKAKNLLALGSEYKLAAEQAIAEAQHWMVKMSSANKSHQKAKLIKLSERQSFREPFIKPHYGPIIPDIVESHDQLIGVSKAIKLKYSKKFGRHFVATRDIKPGEILVKIQDYLVALSLDLNYSHCWNCAKRAWSGIPCRNCVNVMFCDEKCREEAWDKFHDIECLTLTALPARFLGTCGIIALRLTIKALKEAGSIVSLGKMMEKINSILNFRRNSFIKEKLDGSKYANILTLSNCQSALIKSKLAGYMRTSVLVIHVWATETNIFGRKIDSRNELRRNEFILFMIKLFIEHMIICENNAFQASFYQEEHLDNSGGILTFLTSFFNHSCDSNAFIVHSGNISGVRSTYKIKEGQQIFISYVKRYHQLPKNERQKKLKYLFDFCCDCHACEGDWGPKSRWPSIYEQSLPSQVMVNLSREVNKFTRLFKGIFTWDREDLLSTDLHYITPISELLNTLCDKVEYPAKEIATLKNMLVLNYRNNSY